MRSFDWHEPEAPLPYSKAKPVAFAMTQELNNAALGLPRLSQRIAPHHMTCSDLRRGIRPNHKDSGGLMESTV